MNVAPKGDRCIDLDLFVRRIQQRGRQLDLRDDELAGILVSVLLAVCDEFGIDALALVLGAMAPSADEGSN